MQKSIVGNLVWPKSRQTAFQTDKKPDKNQKKTGKRQNNNINQRLNFSDSCQILSVCHPSFSLSDCPHTLVWGRSGKVPDKENHPPGETLCAAQSLERK